MNTRNLAFAGAAALTVGLFLPIVTMPFIGTVNLFGNGTNWVALGLLALAAVSAGLALKDRVADVLFPGLGAAGALLYRFIGLQYSISTLRTEFAEQMKDNPFAGMAQTALSVVQIQWGWLVLALGAGLLIYAGYKARRDTEQGIWTVPDGVSRIMAAISVAVLLLGPALDWLPFGNQGGKEEGVTAVTEVPPGADAGKPTKAAEDKLTQEKTGYITQNLKLYDLEARYMDSMLDGRVPGVLFKIKNNGNRTLNEVKVRVVFQDESGNNIAEEDYYPVNVSEYSFGDNNKPLRPNYVWTNEQDKFYTAKSVPSEWKSGKATASIVDIEFGPNE